MEQESEESHLNKKIKKSASVRFATERSPSSLALDVLEGNHIYDTDIDIRAELHNYLPSNTLHRRKHTVFTPTTFKSLTIPRKNDLGQTLTFNRLRQLSTTTKKRTFLPQSIDTSDLSTEVPAVQTSPEQIEIPSTEEEKIEELINIRNLPIPLTEKKLYRMDSNALNIPMKDIDARLAQFEEFRAYGENSSLQQDSGASESVRHGLLGKQRSYEEQSHFRDSFTKARKRTFIEEPSDRLNVQSCNKHLTYKDEFVCSSSDTRSFSTPLETLPQKITDRPEEHSSESLFKEKRSYLLSDKSSEATRNQFTEQNELYSSFSGSYMPPESLANFSKHSDYKDSSHNKFSMSELCLNELKTSKKLYVDFKRDQIRQYKMNKSNVENSEVEDRWSPQNKDQNSKISIDADNKWLSYNTNFLEHKNAKTFRHLEDTKFVPNYSDSKQKVFSGYQTNGINNIYYTDERARQNSFCKTSDNNNHTEKSNCSYFDTSYDKQNSNIACGKESIKYYIPSSYPLYKKRYVTADHEKNSEGNILSWDHYGAKPKYQFQNRTKHKLSESSLKSLKADSEYLSPDIDLKKYDTNKYLKNEENVNNIRRRQIINSQNAAKTFVMPTGTDFQSRNERATIGTFTMSDARKIAPLVRGNSANCVENRTHDFEIINDDSWFENKRKCWSRICWNKTKHSHAYVGSKDRNAIVNSMRSPQYATKAKKQAFSDCCSTLFKGASSRLQLWNRTLKKIEGQFGTGVVSYFVFLRWLILLNFVIFLLYLLLIILPYSVLSLLPNRNPKATPNETILTSEFLDQFPKNYDVPYSSKRTRLKNVSLDLNEDLLSNLGTLLNNVPNEFLDLTLRYDKRNHTGEERNQHSLYCKDRYEKEMANHTKGTFSVFQDFLQGTGWLQSTILFLGFYPDRDVSFFGLPYNLPVSFVAVLVVSFFLSLVLMLQYSSHGIQENILTRKSSYLTFSNILFCSWDYCIEDKKTAAIRHKSITGEIKSNLTEEHRKLEVSRWSSEKRCKVYLLRIVINILVIAALFGCFYLIYKVVNFQLEKQRQNALKVAGAYTLFIQFLPPLVITALNILMPVIFYNVVKFEMYDTQTQVNIALFRIVFLRLASVFVLVSSLYQQITCEPKDVCKAGMSEFCRSPICWETYVGQQLYKLVITDFLVYIFMFLAYDLPRDLIVQKCRCKVTEVVGRQVFDLPSQVLSLVYSQTLCWLGLFYSPLLPGISVLKFFIIFHIKKVVVLKHCTPAPVLYKASRSNTIFMTILMISLFFATVIHGYSLTSIEPSPGCGPFRKYFIMINAVAEAIADWSPSLVTFMTVLFSGFFFIPAFLLLSVVIYYYWTVVVAHRKMIKVLKAQIAIEGRDKQFLLNRLSEAAKRVTTN